MGGPWAKMLGRADEPPASERPAVGARLPLRDGATSNTKNTVRPEPNAPLLMRIVRHPFALAPVPAKRVEVRSARDQRPAPTLEAPLAYREQARQGARFQNPILVFAHRPEHRPHPFARARAGSEVADE